MPVKTICAAVCGGRKVGKMKISDKAMIALIDYVDASDKNTQMSDDEWAAGFRVVQQKTENLRKYFTSDEIKGFITNRSELREIINAHKTT